jgi:WXG100 family type VII secretion target
VDGNRTGASADALALGANRFESIRDELQSKLTTLRGIVDGVRAEWQGSAGASFQNVTEAWKQRQADLIATLTNTAQAIRTNGTTLGSSNETAKAEIDKVDLTALGGKGGSR